MAHPALAAKGLTKSFGSNEVLRNINFEVNAGRTIALCGENGAGKSTLLKLMTGVYTPSAGQVLLDGDPVVFAGPKEAIAAGIAVVHQEFSTISALTVAENVFLEKEPRNRLGLGRPARASPRLRRPAPAAPHRTGPRRGRSTGLASPRRRWWKSPRRFGHGRACSFWMSRRRCSPTGRSTICSGFCATCGSRGWASSTSRTAWTKFSKSAPTSAS